MSVMIGFGLWIGVLAICQAFGRVTDNPVLVMVGCAALALPTFLLIKFITSLFGF